MEESLLSFTFHSGYIPIMKRHLKNAENIAFTFHSGYIPIEKGYKNIKVLRELYIPFWIYSNAVLFFLKILAQLFTFHSGYIPIMAGKSLDTRRAALHSILDIFQC